MRRSLLTLALVVMGAGALGLISCQGPSAPTQDLSADIARLAVDLALEQTAGHLAAMVDESTSTTETSTASVSMDLSRSAQSVSGSVVVAHSVPLDKTLAAGDVVQVVRTWTNHHGEAIVDTIVRPKVPGAGDFTSPPAYVPRRGNGVDTTGVSATFAGSTWTLSGTETKTVNGIPFVQQTITQTFQWSPGESRVVLTSLVKRGEALGLYTNRVKLDSSLYFRPVAGKDVEFLRVLDYVGAAATLKREIYLWEADPTSVPALARSFTPAVVAAPGLSTVGFWYRSPVATPVAVPVYGTLATYPVLDPTQPVGVVLQERGPRITDGYRPLAGPDGTFPGDYLRRWEQTWTGGGSGTRTEYAADGTTVTRNAEFRTTQAAVDGTVTTVRTFSDGTTKRVRITPLGDDSGRITGYRVVRDRVTYTVGYEFDAQGGVAAVTVTNETTGSTQRYTPQADGSWN